MPNNSIHIEIFINSSVVFTIRNMPRMYVRQCIDMWQITTSSARNENLLHNISFYPQKILSDNENLYTLYKKYVQKIVTHRNYKKHSKREILTVHATKHT